MTDLSAHQGQRFVDEDWYGRELIGETFVDCVFRDVDLTEAVTRGCTFERCEFGSCRFNASAHHTTAFVGSTFRRTSFFDATLDGCKLTGSVFVECTTRPLAVNGGQWRGVTLRGARLTGLDLSGLMLQEADLSEADLSDSDLSGADLTGASLRRTTLHRTDLRRSRLDGVDLATALLRDTRLDLSGAVHLAECLGATVDPL